MRDVLEVQERLGRLFETAFRIEDIAESLVSFDAERPAADVAKVLNRTRFKVAGVREDGRIGGYLVARELKGARTCADIRTEFDTNDVIAGHAPLAEAIQQLAEREWLFVSVLGTVNGIVTWSDLQKPPVRMWLFGVITLLEMAFTSIIETLFTNDAWVELLSPARRRKAEEFFRERQRRGDVAATLRLVDCIQFSDKGQILAKDALARRLIGFPSRKRGEQAVKAVVSLRDKLAHAQDIVSEDGAAIVELATHLQRILQIGSLFPDLKRSVPTQEG
jgi:hypothetical protein